MEHCISTNELPLSIQCEQSRRPLANKLPLYINRELGRLDGYTYVFAGNRPLRIEHRITNRPSSDALPLAISRPHSTISPARYVSTKALPLPINRPLSEQPPSNALPLAINREHSTVITDTDTKPQVQTVVQTGWYSSTVGGGAVRYADRKVVSVGFESSLHGVSTILSEVAEGYFPANQLKLPIAVSTGVRPPSSELPLSIYREHGQWLNRPSIKPTNRKYIYPRTFVDGAFGELNVSLYQQYAQPKEFGGFVAGTLVVRNSRGFVAPTGWHSSQLSSAGGVVNRNQRVMMQGWASSALAKHRVYNLLQYAPLQGFNSSNYGKPYLMGGVKYLSPRGYDASDFGKTSLVNTTANQTAKLKGIYSLSVPAPNVSPRMLYPAGIANPALGRPDVRDPAIKPLGETHTSYGVPTVWFHTRPLSPNGILSYQSGYPRVADPTQFTYPPSLIELAIFGDTAIRNLSFKVSVPAIYDDGFSDYTTFTNSNRYYATKGIDSLVIGVAAIVNKTPSIFVDGITHYDIGTPAIGHAIRFVVPTGFDHLLFGRAVLTKTPEILPRGHQSSVVGQSWISHKDRAIDLIQKGINSFKAGESTVWYGQRPFKSKGWQTASYGKPTLTHEVRELLGQGFRRDAYGIHWISQGLRALEPQGIYKDFPSNHMVGGTQTIKPAGYEATLWGERIIPISQAVQPLGFSELWGNATADLHTKYAEPVGFISVGQQPADRWGDTTVYNKLQYIIQEFDVNSGLVPPKWSDWTAIANRNIQMNVTGFASQRFGYSQIDNNAAPLLPEAITPPPITIGMTSHGIRNIDLDGIEPIPLSTWGVVYNDAHVIAPLGHEHTQWGDDGTVVNTRREYRNVGRIDSLETGTPMIAYAIRTIDIERRYSIAPPQINLPTIHLYNSYVTFRGYEIAKFGTPFVEEHFSILYPKWTHKEKFGEGVVYNNTPEYAAYGHDSSEFGDTSIRTEWRNLYAQGSDTSLFGAVDIADTKREIKIAGWIDSRSSQLHTVIKTGAPPYTPQNIWLQNESEPWKDGFGIKPTSKPSSPGLNQNVIYARGYIATKFGDAFMWSNNLYIDTGIPIQSMDAGPVVSNKKRFLSPAGIDAEIKVSDLARVTPSYLRQYHDYSKAAGEVFGWQTVTNQHRTIYPRGHQSSEVGRYGAYAKVELSTRYIKPKSIRQFLFGVPELPFTPKEVVAYGALSEVFGLTAVKRPPYTGPQDIKGRGFNSLSISNNHRAELLHRELLAVGSNHLRMGRSISGDTPYMWQGLRIGEFVPMEIGAGDTSLFGEARISLKVQPINLEGFIAFRSEYDYTNFNARMKVTGTITDYVTAQGATAGGIDSEAMGSVGVKLGQHFIRPDGNSNQFRKGGYHA